MKKRVQFFIRSIGVCKRLKIGNIFMGIRLFANQADTFFDLFINGENSVGRKISGASFAAENTASVSKGAVPVRTCEASV